MLTLLVCGNALAQIQPAADAPQPLSPIESASRIQLPPGFKIELIASEPVVEEPSCIAFDEFGRMFVCELHGYNVEGEIDVAQLNQSGELDNSVRRLRWERMGGKIADEAAARQYGKLKLLIDENGDGTMDRVEVWADDLPACYGVIVARGGVIVTCGPDIVFFEDRDLDGKPEVREVLFTGFRRDVMERRINNPRWGLDNWIYIGSGGSGGTITGPHLDGSVKLGNSDFRIKADGSAIEPVSGSVGTFGMTINDWGDRFPASGGQPANYALPLPYRFLSRNPHASTPGSTHSAANYNRGNRISAPHPWRVQRQKDPEWVKFYGTRETDSNYFSGGCSNEFYGDDLFPAEYNGCLFYCEPSLNIVHRCLLTRDGLRYKARRTPREEQTEFLASTDQWFRPMNLRVGPDGALYIVDMYREIIEDYSAIPRFLQQQYGINKGRSHGRLWRLAPKDSSLQVLPNMSKLTAKELVAELTSKVAWRRRMSQRLLIERADMAEIKSIEELLKQENSPQAAIHALHTLDGLQQLTADHLRACVSHADPRVRMQAIRLSHGLLDEHPLLLQGVMAATADPSIKVRAEAAMALGATTASQAAGSLLQLAKRDGANDWIVAAILSSASNHADGMLKQALAERPIPAGFEKLLTPLASTLTASGGDWSWLLGQLPLHTASTQTALLSGLLNGLSSDSTVTKEQANSVATLLSGSSQDTRKQAMQLALKLGLKEHPDVRKHFAKHFKRAIDESLAFDARIESLELLHGASFDLAKAAAKHCLNAKQPLDLQLASITLLDSLSHEGVGEALLANWKSCTPSIRKAITNAIFARPNRLPAMWQMLDSGAIKPTDISPAEQEVLLRTLEDAVAERTRAKWRIGKPEFTARLASYVDALDGNRDPKAGKVVFEKHCANCHRVADVGFVVGPDLGTITGKPDAAVLTDILDPNSRIDHEFRSYSVVTRDGRSFMGILASETATNVVLLKEKAESDSVLRRDIEEIVASEISLMPANFHETITPTDAANLLTYLRSMLTKK